MIDSKRLETLLKPNGFEIVWVYQLSRQLHLAYCRTSEADGVFEHVRVESAGKKGESVWCDLVVTPLRAQEFDFKPCPRFDDVLTELAPAGSTRAAVDIRTNEEAIEWEKRIAEIATARVRTLAEQHAEAVSQATAVARHAAAKYIRLIREFSDERTLEYLAVQLDSGRAPAKGQSDPFPGLMLCQGDLQDAKECAALAINKFGALVDPDSNGFQTDELRRTTEYKLRVCLVADLLRNGA
ncbi:MAG: hypothetical protein NXI04_03305 [Planctomycetaceae bacterium]|nr:hypothetical protein [Planctomycetaceae bacterium]